MNTIESNRLIAIFMGWTYNGHSGYQNPEDDGDWWELENMMFDSGWHWLMPVLVKTKSIWDGYEFDTPEYEHIENEIFSLDNTLVEFMNADINAIYERVVNFIEWYNKQEK